MARPSILLVDDDPSARFAVREYLGLHGFLVHEADTAAAATEQFRTARPDLAILDYMLPDGNALELLPRLKAIEADVPIIILTGHGTIDLAVQAIKEGADQFLTKPVQLSALQVLVERALDNRRVRKRQEAGAGGGRRESIDPFQGTSALIRSIEQQARKVLDSDAPILIQGETGSGKGVLARWLHENGPRKDEAFVDLNCAGLSRDLLESELFGHERGAFTGAVSAKKGLLEVADRGTVFLDEIGDVASDLQPKLLKVLEEKKFRRLGDVRDRIVDIRLLAATHQDLARSVEEGRFRSDLYFRINALPLVVPALRERPEDIPVIANRLVGTITRDLGRGPVVLSPDAVEALQAYRWPGNIRELRNVLERAILLSSGEETLDAVHLQFTPGVRGRSEAAGLPPGAPGAPPTDGTGTASPLTPEMTLEEVERAWIEKILTEEGGRVEPASRRLGIPRSSLYNKIKRYNITVSKF
jgi:DNA-binding NtrC family response regulator